MATALILLAAGQGTRMRSDLPKVLHEIGGAPLLVHAMRSGAALAPEIHLVATGHGGEAVGAAARAEAPEARVVHQERQMGTAHAVLQAAPALEGFAGDAVVLYGDTPLIRGATLEAMIAARAHHDIVVLGFEAADPARYGRLIVAGERLERIVEYAEATPEERAITLCNSGVLCADAGRLMELAAEVGNDNAKGEYYLTDIVALARARGLSAGVVRCDEAETIGVNSRADLAAAEAAFQARARTAALEGGATLTAPETVFFAIDTRLGRDSTVEPHVVFGPGVTVESGAVIRAFSHLEGAHVGHGAVVGPYARLRPGTVLAAQTRVGNFVETKNAVLETGAKANHLTYLGDAHVGAGANIGAGTITCNYDGVSKHRSEIGAGAFIGSDTMLVAPVRVGAEAMTGSGSVITADVPDGALGLGRARQTNKPGLARRLMERLRAARSRRAG
ncbi:bifunctional N-acetylglucosamine-1-phosphate uridyltransferase/glucosamine-1-phosphate acetyltransferase [Rhodobacteraceae bacterium WD3A24]|nr:bifunctional N-acetylglucosamine-1-phosphate uridyltransferase/glucosamine-1-phosphate acetyltransferase [Rhodobacteraceae bacterium WD3A24]